MREALAESQNKNREDTENETKYLAEIVSIKNDLDFKAKKISDTDKKVEEIKQEKKILQDSNQKMSDVKFYFLIFKIENQTIRGWELKNKKSKQNLWKRSKHNQRQSTN